MSDVGRYRKVYPRLWRHPGFSSLKPSARELVLYLLTGPQTSSIGLFHFSIATAAEDLDVSIETVRKGLVDIGAMFGWHCDAVARVIYIPSWWRWNRPENENVLKGNLKALSEIPPCGLVDAFARNVETLPETLRERFMECCHLRLPKRPPNQEQYQEHLQKQEKEHERVPSGSRKETQSEEAKNGTEREDLLPVAREVLKFANRTQPIDELVDVFYQIRTDRPCEKAEATRLIHIVLQETRPS